MVDVVVTPANVIPASGAAIAEGTAGEAITAGEAVYKDANDSQRVKLAQHDNTEAEAESVGIALNNAAANQPVKYIRLGDLDFGAVLTAGTVYAVSATPGGIAPISDVGVGDYVTVLGVATSAARLRVSIIVSGAQSA